MNKLYENSNFKELMEPVFLDNSKIKSVYSSNLSITFDKNEIIALIRKDIKNMDYESIKGYDVASGQRYSIVVDYLNAEGEKFGVNIVSGCNLSISPEFVNTYKYICNMLEEDKEGSVLK